MALIAIVEDERSQRRLLQALLESRGHAVRAFCNGREALAGVDGDVALVITDLAMPEMTGVEFCAALRKRYSQTELSVVAVSALDDEDEILKALDAGANDFISKPYPPSLLYAKVALQLEERASYIHDATTRRNKPRTRPFALKDGQAAQLPAQFGRYILERVLGRGAFGVVFEARSGNDGPVVALKIFDESLCVDRAELSRYLREVATLSSLECSTIVQFVGAGHEAGRYYLVMELVAGSSASDLVRSTGPLSLHQVLRVGADISEALEAIHQKGVVHRDVKPHNIMLGEDGRAKLIDFGLAKPRLDASLTKSSELLGTLRYLSPELLRGVQASPGSDLYALGVTLHELCTGKRAHKATTPEQLLGFAASRKGLPRLEELAPATPPGVSSLIAELTTFEPGERLCDAAACKARCEALLRAHA